MSKTLDNGRAVSNRSSMPDFRRLTVWQRAHELTLQVYEVTSRYPASERFGLVEQSRKAAASIPMNIAEGAGRGSDRDFARFLRYGVGSANEVDYQILLARDLRYIDDDLFQITAERVGAVRAMLRGLLSTLGRS